MAGTRTRVAVNAAIGAAAALGVVAVVLKARDGSHGVADLVLTSLSGVLFLAAGVFAARRAPGNQCGLLMVLVGLGLFAEDLQLATDPVLFTFGLLVAHASTPLVTHLVLAFPHGRLVGRASRAAVVAGYVAAFAVSGVGTLFFDWAARVPGKPDNLLLIVDAPAVSGAIDRSLDLAGMVIGAVVLVILARRLVAAGPRSSLALVVSVALVGAAGSAVAGAFGSDHPQYSLGLIVYKVAFCLWPLTFAAGVAATSPRSSEITDLLAALRGPCTPDRLRDLLARALHDDSLRLVEWTIGSDRFQWHDLDGNPVTPGSEDRTVILAQYPGRLVAAIMRRDTTWDDPRIIRAAGTVAGLVAEHRRMLGEARTQLAASQLSGVRLVELADAERRRVERDLHDGAQQRLVTVALGLRLAQQELAQRAEPDLAGLLTASAEGLDAAMAELRDLARGIHPAILTQAGLTAAVSALLERTPLAVTLSAPELPRFSDPVEATAYFVVAEAVTNALKHARATQVRVELATRACSLEVTVHDNGIGGASSAKGSGLDGLLDRVRALGGTMAVHGEPGAGTTVHAAIPAGERR